MVKILLGALSGTMHIGEHLALASLRIFSRSTVKREKMSESKALDLIGNVSHKS